jgi:hypothetical protein
MPAVTRRSCNRKRHLQRIQPVQFKPTKVIDCLDLTLTQCLVHRPVWGYNIGGGVRLTAPTYVLLTDGVGQRTATPVTARVEGRIGTVPRPNLIEALVMKAAAQSAVGA